MTLRCLVMLRSSYILAHQTRVTFLRHGIILITTGLNRMWLQTTIWFVKTLEKSKWENRCK